MLELTVLAASARASARPKTIVECPSEKKKPTPSGPLLVLQHLPRGVVDRRDVVGVERVPQSERVRQHPEPGKSRAAVDVVEEETPAGDVQQRDCRAEAGETEPFRPSQGLRPPASAHCVGDSPRKPDRFGPGR